VASGNGQGAWFTIVRLLVDDEFRRVVKSMRLAHIPDDTIATALGISAQTLKRYFGRWFLMEGKQVPLKINGVVVGTATVKEETNDHIIVQCRITVPMPVRYALPPGSSFSFQLPGIEGVDLDLERWEHEGGATR